MPLFKSKNTEYYEESFDKLDFSEKEIIANKYDQCVFNGCIFRRTNLTKANLTDALNYSIDFNYNNLKEAIFSLPEAISLLKSLDINLADSHDK